MKVRRLFFGALGVTALASATVFGAAGSARPVATSAAKSCKASINIEAPFATGPATQLGGDQLHFAELAVAMANKANHTQVTLGQSDTGLNPSLATTRSKAIIASKAVAVVGPAGSQEVLAVGPLFAKAGMAFITGSASLPALTTNGANTTFFRVIPNDNVQGPQDANYIVNHKLAPAGSTILLIDDQEAYSQGLASVMEPVFTKAGYKVDHQSYNGTDSGATLQSALSSLVTAHITSDVHVVVIPWQSPGNAELFGQTVQSQGKSVTLFGTDGTNSPGQFTIPGSYASNFGPDISNSKGAIEKAIVSGVAKYGRYSSFGVPTWTATTVEMDAIAAVCKAGKPVTRANVLAAVRKTNIPASKNPEGVAISFTSKGDLKAQAGYLFFINKSGAYQEIGTK